MRQAHAQNAWHARCLRLPLSICRPLQILSLYVAVGAAPLNGPHVMARTKGFLYKFSLAPNLLLRCCLS